MDLYHHDDMLITKTNVIYNDNFKNFIKKMKRNFSEDDLKTQNLEDKMDLQDRIRKYIVKNQKEIDMKNNKKMFLGSHSSHEDFFCIFIALLIRDEKLDDFKNLNEILEYNKKHEAFGMSGYACSDAENTGSSQLRFCCACAHDCSPQNLYVINNPDTFYAIIVGSECIKKYKIIEPRIIETVIKTLKNDKNYKKFKNIKKNEKKMLIEGKLEKKLNENIMSFKINYKNIGANFGDNLVKFKADLINDSYQIDYVIEYIQDTIQEKCRLCEKNNKKKYIFKNNIDNEFVALCKTCCSDLGYNNKKKCKDCRKYHRNRKDNYCNDCRLKSICTTCNDRKICKLYDNFNRCDDCSLLKYCKECKKDVVTGKNTHCKKCYNLCKKCECGRRITDNKYNTCYNCHING
jgi:hypothetical protein